MMISPDDQERVDAIEQALLARWPETRIAPSTERIAALVDLLGSPQLTYPTIHIGGTNGKTTTSRMIDSLLFAHGLRTGRFTSPHLETYRERIAINGEPIDPKELIFSYNDIAAYLDLMDSKFEHPISFFEAITALAFAAFSEHPIDVGVIEVGMGGEWDATNVVDRPALTIITPVSIDHQQYLGETLPEIAGEKAGIIKRGVPVIVGPQATGKSIFLQTLKLVLDRDHIHDTFRRHSVSFNGDSGAFADLVGEYERLAVDLQFAEQSYTAAMAAYDAAVAEWYRHWIVEGFTALEAMAPETGLFGGAQLAAEIEVGGGIDVIGDGERLVDRFDAILLGVARVVDIGEIAADQDVAVVALVGAGEDLDQGRLAGTVMAEQGHDFAREEVDGGVIDGVNAAEGDGNVAHFHEGGAVFRHEFNSPYFARAR